MTETTELFLLETTQAPYPCIAKRTNTPKSTNLFHLNFIDIGKLVGEAVPCPQALPPAQSDCLISDEFSSLEW